VYDALIISDIHLGSDNCQARMLVRFLESIREQELRTTRLILNGDVFDSIDFRRLKKQHWKILSLLRKLSDEIEILWINGNHDGPAEIISHLLGVTVSDQLIFTSGDRRVLVLHGHRFDEFIERYPLTSKIADTLYRWLQRIDKTHYVARQAKSSSKTFLRCAQKVRDAAIAYARAAECQVVCCGHTHLPGAIITGEVDYYNSGCWTERPCHYLSIRNGVVSVEMYDESLLPEEVREPSPLLVPVPSTESLAIATP